MEMYPFNLQKSPWMQAITAVFRQSTDRKRTLASVHRRRQSPRLRLERLELRNLLASWVEGFGGGGAEMINAFPSMDPSGNIYVAGQYNSQPADFDPGPGTTNLTSVGGMDAFAAKYASDGSLIWARSFGGTFTGDDVRASVYSSEQGGNFLYVTGIFSGTASFGGPAGNLTSSNAVVDTFIAKLDAANGNTVWAKRIGGTSSTIPSDIVVTHDVATNTNKIHIAGRFEGTTDFDPGPGTVSLSPAGNGKMFDGFLLTLDTNGDYGLARRFGGSGADNGSSLETDGTSLFLVGNVEGTVDLDPGTGVKNASGYFVAKYASSASAAPTWVRSTNGGYYVTGDGDSLYVTSSSPTVSLVVAKYAKADGSLLWTKQYSGSGTTGSGVVDPATGSLYISGHFSSTIDFNPGVNGGEVTSRGGTDGLLLKLNTTSGDYQQVWRMGGTGNDRARGVSVHGTTVYVSGYFLAVADFPTGGTLTSSGVQDIFLMALDQTASPAPLLLTTNVSPKLSSNTLVSLKGIANPSQSTTSIMQSSSKILSPFANSSSAGLKPASMSEGNPTMSRRLATKRNSVDLAIADKDLDHQQHSIADDLIQSLFK